MRKGLAQRLPWQDIGFEVCGSVENGKQALQYIRQNPVDVVLCDIVMPVMTGLELLEALRGEKITTRLVFYSAHENFQYIQEALELGAANYVLKSASYHELIRVFTKLLTEMDEQNPDAAKTQEKILSYNEKIISIIKIYTQEHYRDISLEALTSIVHMNADYISKFFKKHSGIYFSEYLIRVRMLKAAQLLDQVEHKTYQVGEMVGYSNAFNFTRAFKNFFGVTPKQYRSQKLLIPTYDPDVFSPEDIRPPQ